jgi:hypothetical protein
MLFGRSSSCRAGCRITPGTTPAAAVPLTGSLAGSRVSETSVKCQRAVMCLGAEHEPTHALSAPLSAGTGLTPTHEVRT